MFLKKKDRANRFKPFRSGDPFKRFQTVQTTNSFPSLLNDLPPRQRGAVLKPSNRFQRFSKNHKSFQIVFKFWKPQTVKSQIFELTTLNVMKNYNILIQPGGRENGSTRKKKCLECQVSTKATQRKWRGGAMCSEARAQSNVHGNMMAPYAEVRG